MEESYRTVTNLAFHANTLTQDMTDYHAFYKAAFGTPAIIIETGFMNQDRELLTTYADVPAKAISEGILCFISATR
jgi:N-acetylmuramoyl-L-alanine amidase